MYLLNQHRSDAVVVDSADNNVINICGYIHSFVLGDL